MNKYLVTESIPYEGENRWTVFANTEENAKSIVKLNGQDYCNNPLSTELLRANIKGTKTEAIIGHRGYWYQ